MRAEDYRRLLRKIDTTGGVNNCWLFNGARTGHGYGNIWIQGRYVSAHRAMYIAVFGAIPEDLEVDHLCHDGLLCPGGSTCPHRACVNPLHLGLATHRNNGLRGSGPCAKSVLKTHCPVGHPYNEANTYYRPGVPEINSKRDCRPCRTAAEARRRARVRALRDLNSDQGSEAR